LVGQNTILGSSFQHHHTGIQYQHTIERYFFTNPIMADSKTHAQVWAANQSWRDFRGDLQLWRESTRVDADKQVAYVLTNSIKPHHPRLYRWLKQNLTEEFRTKPKNSSYTHPGGNTLMQDAMRNLDPFQRLIKAIDIRCEYTDAVAAAGRALAIFRVGRKANETINQFITRFEEVWEEVERDALFVPEQMLAVIACFFAMGLDKSQTELLRGHFSLEKAGQDGHKLPDLYRIAKRQLGEVASIPMANGPESMEIEPDPANYVKGKGKRFHPSGKGSWQGRKGKGSWNGPKGRAYVAEESYGYGEEGYGYEEYEGDYEDFSEQDAQDYGEQDWTADDAAHGTELEQAVGEDPEDAATRAYTEDAHGTVDTQEPADAYYQGNFSRGFGKRGGKSGKGKGNWTSNTWTESNWKGGHRRPYGSYKGKGKSGRGNFHSGGKGYVCLLARDAYEVRFAALDSGCSFSCVHEETLKEFLDLHPRSMESEHPFRSEIIFGDAARGEVYKIVNIRSPLLGLLSFRVYKLGTNNNPGGGTQRVPFLLGSDFLSSRSASLTFDAGEVKLSIQVNRQTRSVKLKCVAGLHLVDMVADPSSSSRSRAMVASTPEPTDIMGNRAPDQE
jgi:hypothetical protein